MIRLDLLSNQQTLDRNLDQNLDPILTENNRNRSDYVNLIENNENNGNKKYENKNENKNNEEFSGNFNEFSQGNTVGFRAEKEHTIKSFHLQSDYANLKKMEEEIQSALNSLNSTNSQNRIDYNS